MFAFCLSTTSLISSALNSPVVAWVWDAVILASLATIFWIETFRATSDVEENCSTLSSVATS
jgi:hypothetical protein